MYNSEFICTYPFYDISLAEKNPISIKYAKDKEKENAKKNAKKKEQDDEDDDDDAIINDLDLSDYIYKSELLNAFYLEEYDEIINTRMNELYLVVTTHEHKEEILKCITKLMEKQMIDDMEIAFSFLFSYDYFHITHLCISDMLNGRTMKDNIDMLLLNISS